MSRELEPGKREPGLFRARAGSQVFFRGSQSPEPVKKVTGSPTRSRELEPGKQEPEPAARYFLEGARAESRQPVKKVTGSPTLVYGFQFLSYIGVNNQLKKVRGGKISELSIDVSEFNGTF